MLEGPAAHLDMALQGHHLDLTEQQIDLLVQHLQLVLQANIDLNLTAIRDLDSGLVLHIEDSLLALREVESAPDGMLGDLGSGAGYPGIPLAIVSGRQTTLIDSSQKKARTVKGIVEKLGLACSVSVCDQRAEDLARSCPGSFSILTARALSSLPSLLELASPLLRKGGLFVALKATPEEEEIERGERVAALVGMSLVSKRDVSLSNGDARSILCYEKERPSSVGLPRRTGMAQKRPLA